MTLKASARSLSSTMVWLAVSLKRRPDSRRRLQRLRSLIVRLIVIDAGKKAASSWTTCDVWQNALTGIRLWGSLLIGVAAPAVM